MPTYSQISKTKSALILSEELKIKRRIELIQESIYRLILPDLTAIANNKKMGRPFSLNTIATKFKKAYGSSFPEIMKLTFAGASKVTDLNQSYFSSLLGPDGMDKIGNKTKQVLSKRMGIAESGKIIKNGFTDKVINSKKAQNEFVKTVNAIVKDSPDINSMQNKLKDFITGSKESTGNLERYYRNTAQDVIMTTDRANSLIYADELELDHFVYSGGIITTSRSFCIEKNRKVFTRSQAEKWRDSAFIKKMYKGAAYDPLVDMGGYGCRHTPDFITADIAAYLRKRN